MDRAHTHDWRGYWEIERNINNALEAFSELAREGIGAFCPHGHSAHFEVIAPDVPPEYWYNLDLHFLKTACDAVLVLPGWGNSAGSRAEVDWAIQHGLRVFSSLLEVIAWAAEK